MDDIRNIKQINEELRKQKKLYDEVDGRLKSGRALKKDILRLEEELKTVRQQNLRIDDKANALQKMLAEKSKELAKRGGILNAFSKRHNETIQKRIQSSIEMAAVIAGEIRNGHIQNDLAMDMLQLMGDIEEGKGDVLDISRAQTVAEQNIINQLNEQVEAQNRFGKALTNVMQKGMGLAKKLGLAVLGIFAAKQVIDALTTFDGRLNSVGDTFGDLTMGGQAFNNQLVNAGSKAIELGFGLDDVLTVVTGLSSEFGISVDKAADISNQVLDTAKAVGVSVDEATKLVGVFVKIGGLTAEEALNLTEATAQLARQNGVAPVVALQDIAASAEDVAAFTKDGGKNIAEAAVAARQLGRDFGSVAQSARGVLNLEDSIQKVAEANAVFGTDINLNKLRELSFSGDLVGFQKEQIRLAKQLSRAAGDDVISREIAAEALGVSVAEFQKLVNSNDALAKQRDPLRDLIGNRAQGGLTSLVNTFKSLKDTLIVALGPAVEAISKGVANFIRESGGIDAIREKILEFQGSLGQSASDFAEKILPQISAALDRVMVFIEGGGLMKIIDGFKKFGTIAADLGMSIANIAGGVDSLVTRIKRALSGAAIGAALGAAALLAAPFTGGASLAALPLIKTGALVGAAVGAGGQVEAQPVTSPQEEQQDFVMRPGQAPVSFSSDDTIVGFKGAMGGNNKEVVNAINALSEKVTAGIPLSATVTGHQLNLTTDTGYAGGRPGLNSGLMTK